MLGIDCGANTDKRAIQLITADLTAVHRHGEELKALFGGRSEFINKNNLARRYASLSREGLIKQVSWLKRVGVATTGSKRYCRYRSLHQN